jgi:hypothetical protein
MSQMATQSERLFRHSVTGVRAQPRTMVPRSHKAPSGVGVRKP